MSQPLLARTRQFLALPPRAFEVGIWVFLAVAIVAVRVYLWHLLPFVLWSKDAGSYALSAWQWLDGGGWVTDPRRGPIYSLFLAACLKAFGSFNAVIFVQHVLGGLSVFAAIVFFRKMVSRRALLVVALCGWAYAVYGGPISMEALIRNETLLLLFATSTLITWRLALEGSRHWLWLCGVSASLLSLTKSVFVPFPLIALFALYWLNRRHPTEAITRMAILLCALLLPVLGEKAHHQMTGHDRPSEPQSGLLLFARVAQFTVLEGGIEPEIKALIRPDIEAYRQIVDDDDLDNNIPLNRTAVPHMRQWLLAQGQTPSDLNNLCRRLALEAIHAHLGEYAKQVWNDFSRLHLTFATKVRGPGADAALSTKKMLLAMPDAHPTLHREATIAAIDARFTGSKTADRKRLAGYAAWVDTAWLFQCAPVLLTSLLLPVLIWRSAGADRWWWLTLAVIWYFNGVLLSTVGKPLDRYLIPVMPIMFWALSSAVAAAWLALLAWLEQRSRPVSL